MALILIKKSNSNRRHLPLHRPPLTGFAPRFFYLSCVKKCLTRLSLKSKLFWFTYLLMSFPKLLNRLFLGPRVTEKQESFLKTDEEFETVGAELKSIVINLYGGRSLRIRAVDGGSTNAEEIELTALNNAYYDIDRFGLSFVASPRHADMVWVTGPVTRNLEKVIPVHIKIPGDPPTPTQILRGVLNALKQSSSK